MTTSSRPTLQTDPALAWPAIHRGFLAIFGIGGLVHVSLGIADPDSYRPFADAALFDWVRRGWLDIFMAHPTLWALVLAAGEFVIAGLLLAARRTGYVAVVGFHLALMLFGWGFWLWCLPALAFAVPATVHEFRETSRRETS
ncbi:hypothetical protein GCM10009554_08850 [Kribbella koreensis]|uniref:DoxX family membrane protein n=1 Tax=Kribbella koreensis TaxID=57909 RepID=A0ABN1PG76_9ACTN